MDEHSANWHGMCLSPAEMQLLPPAQIWTAPAAALGGQHQHLLSAVPERSLSFASLPSHRRNPEIQLSGEQQQSCHCLQED